MQTAPVPRLSRPSRYQTLGLAIAVAVPFALLVELLFGGSTPAELLLTLAVVLVYSLCLGGVFAMVMPLTERRVAATRFPFDWILFLALLTLSIGLAEGIASFILYMLGVVPHRVAWDGLLFINRLVLGITLLFGVFSFIYSRMKERLGRRNLELQRDLERESLEVRAQRRELEKARQIQEALLPKKLPQLAGFTLAGSWKPARTVSGDYFDVLSLAESAVGLCIADVVGKGISAALLMSNLQAAVKVFASPGTSPSELCGEVNRVIADHVAEGKFITFFYALLDPGSGRLVYSCAGHNPPVIVRRDGSSLRLATGGPVLGVFPDRVYQQEEIATTAGDRLLLFTDGVTEAANAAEEEFGEQRLVSLIVDNRHLGAEELTSEVLSAVTEFSEGNLTDDVTLLALCAD